MSGTPPTHPLEPFLPFDDPARDDAWFENAVRDLLRLHGYLNVEFYGGPGDRQEGIDIRADDDGQHIGIQAKKRDEFGDRDVEDAVTAATYPADRFILALSRRATVGARKAIDRHKDRWELWDKVRLSDLVRELPHNTAVHYIEGHFHPAFVETFLGAGRSTTFVERDTYFASFSDPNRLIYHGWQRVGPSTPLDEITTFLSDERERVAFVTGAIGLGKTKALYDFTVDETVASHRVYFLTPRSMITAESLREIRAGNCLVVVDDADDVESLPALLGHLLQRSEAKLLITVSAAGFPKLRDSVVELGFEPAQIREVRLERLGRNHTIQLVQQVLGREYAQVEEAIVMHASDSPLTTILTTRLIRDRQTSEAALESEERVRELVSALYRDVTIGAVSEEIPRSDVKAVLQVLAATGPAKLEQDDWLERAAAFLDWDVDRLLRALDAIDAAGVLLRRGFRYSIAPEIVRQAILLDACVAHGRATRFPTKLYEFFPLSVQLLRNVAIADVESRRSNGPVLFDGPWQMAEAGMRETYSLERASFFEHLDELAFYKPDEVFELVSYLIDHPATNDETQPFAEYGERFIARHDTVLRHVPKVLRAVMLSSPAHVRACVEILWRLGKNKETRSVDSDPLRTIKELAGYENGFGTRVAEEVVEAVAALVDAGEVDEVQHSVLELISPVLARDITSFTSRGSQLVVQRAVLQVQSVTALRDRAIAVLSVAAIASEHRNADTAIKMLGELMREPMNQWVTPSEETIAAWDRERNMAFDAFDNIIDAGTWPVRELRIANVLPWYARHSPSAVVRTRSGAILERLTPSAGRDRYRALIPEFLRFDTFVDVGADNAWNDGARLADEFVDATARELLAAYDDPAAMLDDLATRIGVIESAGIACTPQYLFASIDALNKPFSSRLLDVILARNDTRFYRWLDPFIRGLLMANPVEGETLARRLLEVGNIDVAVSVAHGLRFKGNSTAVDATARNALFEELLRHADVRVRMAAADAMIFFTRNYPERAPDLIIGAEIGEESQLAHQLFMSLPNDAATLDDATLERFVQKLRTVKELEYWPLEFLRRIAPTHPKLIMGLFAWRITHGSPDHEYRAVPYVDTTLRKVFEAMVQSSDFGTEFFPMLAQYRDLTQGRRHDFGILFGYVAVAAPEVAEAAIERALNSDDSEQQHAAVAWVRAVPHEALSDDVEFLVRIVERAFIVSREFGDKLYGPILNALTSGAESVDAYKAAPSDVRLQIVADAAIAKELSPRARRLFEALREHGRRSAERTIRHTEETLGPQ